MKKALSCVSLMAVLTASPVWAEDVVAQDGPLRPGDEEGTALPSDGMAECAAILAVGSSVATNIIDRRRMENMSASWFAASGDVAETEGGLPGSDVWEKKVTDWSGKIGSVDGMSLQADWMNYCAEVGQQNELDTQFFPVTEQIAESEQAAEDDVVVEQ